jgi:hypothetical protein
MSQKRIVLEEICNQTGVTTLSQLFTLLLVNYGDRFVDSLKQD